MPSQHSHRSAVLAVAPDRARIDEAIRCGLLEDGEARHGWNIILRSKAMFQEEPAGAWTMNPTMFHERLKAAVGNWLGELGAGNEIWRENMRAYGQDSPGTICSSSPWRK